MQVKQQKGSLEQIDAKKSISQEPHGQLIELQTQNAMLTADLSTAQQSLERKMALLEQSHYNHNSAKYYIIVIVCRSNMVKFNAAI